ncbi:MAG: hypothetical protein ACYCQI_04900 [Gammaproteobacteria bacterium]
MKKKLIDNTKNNIHRDGKKRRKKKWKPIFKQFYKLTLAIRNRKKGDITSSGDPDYIVTVKEKSAIEKELLEFWKLLDATLDEVITAGKKPFNPDLLLEAFKTYDKHFEDYFGDDWRDPRALLFWQKVIGYDGIQRFMPVNYVQAFHDWLHNTVEKLQKNQPQDRSTHFEVYHCNSNYVPVVIYPLQRRSCPGYNFAIDGGSIGLLGLLGGGCEQWMSKLMSIKNSRLTKLMPERQDYQLESAKFSCQIM